MLSCCRSSAVSRNPNHDHVLDVAANRCFAIGQASILVSKVDKSRFFRFAEDCFWLNERLSSAANLHCQLLVNSKKDSCFWFFFQRVPDLAVGFRGLASIGLSAAIQYSFQIPD